MNIAILSLYTEEHSKLNEITSPSKEEYARKWGYKFINHFGSLDESRPHAWSKIKLVQRHLVDYDWIYWLDSDAMIMDLDIDIQDFLVDYDMIIAQESRRCYFGNYQFNTGSFFLRNSSWSQNFLERSYSFTQFMEHPYWDQAAMRHALDTDPEACKHVYIELDQRKFNSWAGGYRKGDFVFHAYNFLTSAQVKENLLQKIIDQDEKIPSDKQPDIKTLFLINRNNENSTILPEFALKDMIEQNEIEKETNFQLIDATPDELTTLNFGQTHGSLVSRIKIIREKLQMFPGEYLAFCRPDMQFLDKSWKRSCIVAMEGLHGRFLENGAMRGELGDAFMILRSTPEVVSYFNSAYEYLTQKSDTAENNKINWFAELVAKIPPASHGCSFSLFGNNVQNTEEVKLKGAQLVFTLQIQSVECIPEHEKKRELLLATRESWEMGIQNLRELRPKS